MESPFVASYYVDPNFTGTSTGSSDSPFTTIAAAFTYALSLGLIGAVIFIQPSGTVVENVVFPDHGDWEISCQDSSRLATISGTVSCSSGTATPSPKLRLTNLTVTGAISGDAATGQSNFLVLTNCRINSSVTLTATGTGTWTLQPIGRCTDLNSFGGFINGAVSVAGAIHATNWSFQGPISWTVTATQFFTCRFGTGSLSSAVSGISAVKFVDCTFVTLTTVTGSGGSLAVQMDGVSLASAMTTGLVMAGTASLKTWNSNASANFVDNNNRSPTAFGARDPEGLYECSFDATLLAPGVNGNWQFSVNYTDITGTAVTEPVGSPLNIAGAVGSKTEGSHRFHHDGSSVISFSTSGIVTPGSAQVNIISAITRLN